VARRGRDTTDSLILLIAATICVVIVLATVGVFTLALVHPDLSLSSLVGNLNDVISTLVGLLAGWLAGRTDRARRLDRRRQEEDDEP
jgi:membrane associated rhomboid family serine protease